MLEVVRKGPPREWPPQPVVEQAEPASINSGDFEFLSDTYILDLRQWKPMKRDKAYYFRRIRAKKLSSNNRLIVQYDPAF